MRSCYSVWEFVKKMGFIMDSSNDGMDRALCQEEMCLRDDRCDLVFFVGVD